MLKHWDLADAVLQTHDRLVLHTGRGEFSFPSPYTWCTFDYRPLCETLFERSGAKFLQAVVQRMDGEEVFTSQGTFRARCVVDATGWRAVLAASRVPGFARQHSMNFGIETLRPFSERDLLPSEALHFWYENGLLQKGVGWVFPRGETANIGLASYTGARQLRRPLETFGGRFACSPDGIHGTYFPHTLRTPTAGTIFLVGDAAGMCMGLTGEGIRPALFFGEVCGGIICDVLDGKKGLRIGLSEYAAYVRKWRLFFRIFSGAQVVLPRLSPRWIDFLARVIEFPRVRQWLFEQYWMLSSRWGVPV